MGSISITANIYQGRINLLPSPSLVEGSPQFLVVSGH
jgi:hypothetical protein